MIVDSHCHLEYEPMFSNLDQVVKRALENNVKYLLSICTNDESFNKILKIIDKYNNIYGTYGIHPHEAKSFKEIKSNQIMEKISKNKKIIGIGETGLDFYYKNSEINIQKKVFVEHIKAAQETGLPVIVHTRSAEKETYEILKTEKKNKDFKILIHCFTGSKEFSNKLIDLGCYISASGIVTFKKSIELAETFKSIPIERILVETDAPYLSPEPLRGKSNEPSHLKHTVEFLSKIKNIDQNSFSDITTKNFFKVFGELN